MVWKVWQLATQEFLLCSGLHTWLNTQGGIRVNLTPKSRQGFYITRQDEHAPVSMTFPGEGGSENHENFDIFQVFPEWHEKSDIFRGSLKKFLKAKNLIFKKI